MQVILLGVTMFTIVIVTLVALLMWARTRLVPEGGVLLQINDDPDNALSVTAGQTLLSALATKDVFIPSACGGKGTCGLCKVQVEGAGEPLPTERNFLTRGEVLRGSRLACQVKVKNDLKVGVPAEAFDIKHITCKVISNDSVADFIKELVLELPAGEEVDFKAGQYMQIACPANRIAFTDFDIPERFRKSWDRWGLWDYVSVCDEPLERAYSMASYPGEKGVIKFDIKIALPPGGAPKGTPPGKLSSYLFALKPGDELVMSGPYGDFGAADTNAEMLFIGGGAGMAPLRSIIYDQLGRGTNRKMSYWYRAHSLRDALYLDDMLKLEAGHDNFKWELCLSKPEPEDNWSGYTGYIHNFIYDTYLKDHPAPEDCEYYLCGPRALSIGVLELLYDLGVEQESIFYDNFAGEDQVGSH